MNSRIKRKLRVLANETNLTEKGQAKVTSLDEKSRGKLIRPEQKAYFEKQKAK